MGFVGVTLYSSSCLRIFQEHHWSDRGRSEGVQYDVQVSSFEPQLLFTGFYIQVRYYEAK